MILLYENNTSKNINKNLIEKTIITSLEYENIKNQCEVSVTIVNNTEIQKLNKRFRNIDKATDVLSFPLNDFSKEPLPPVNEMLYLGDIVISIDRAEEQAKEYGHSLARELGFLTAHSMLHLLGYDHMNPIEEKEMFTKQEEILNLMGLRR